MQNQTIPRYVYPGIFILCFGLLYYELFLVRVLAFVGGSHSIYLTIAFAMLGLAAASSMVSVIPDRWRVTRSAVTVPVLTALTGWMALVSLLAASIAKDFINGIELQAMQESGFMGLVSISHDTAFISICVLGVVSSTAYFFFGATLSFLFRACREQDFGRLYAWDLFGACAGCVGVVVAMEFFDFPQVAAFCVIIPACAALVFSLGARSRKLLKLSAALNLIAVFVAIFIFGTQLEPKPMVQRLARDYNDSKQSEELWHVWNSYGRISGVKTQQDGREIEVIVHGNGEGHASVPDEGSGEPISVKFSTIGDLQPQRVLVLLAGAGVELHQFREHLGDAAEIVGVELIGDVFQQPYDRDMGLTRQTLDRDNIRMVRGEAREFLARDQSHYDTILVSWSGASLSYFSGAASSAADFIYTKEALQALLKRLSPDGQLILLNGNKVRHIFALKEIFEQAEDYAPIESSLIVSNHGGADKLGLWRQVWDDQRLVVKPSGYSEQEVRDVSEFQQVLYDPTVRRNPTNWYEAAVVYDSAVMQAQLSKEYAVNLSVVTDDKPFILDTFPFEKYFSRDFWLETSEVPLWRIKQRHVQFILLFAVTAAILILLPLAFGRQQTGVNLKDRLPFLFYFASIGAGFMFFEIALISKLQLLIGHPGYVIAVVLASVILFTGVGSLSLDRNLTRFRCSSRSLALLAVASMFVSVVLFELLEPVFIAWPFAMKCFIAFIVPALPCYFMGHLFPYGLRLLSKLDSKITPWALAINGVAGTLATGMTLILAQAFGYNSMILLGIVAYLIGALSLRNPLDDSNAQG